MSRPLPLHEPAERARHGGTTAPSQASVWDLSTPPAPSDVSTEHLTGGAVDDVTEHPAGSPPIAAEVAAPSAAARGGSVATVMVATVAITVVIGALYLLTARTSDAGSGRDPVAAAPTDAPPSLAELATQAGAADAADLFSERPPATVPPATVPPATVPPATVPELVPPATVPPATVPLAAVPATVPEAAVPATVAPAGPRVEIVTRTEPCKFGASCLVAGYVLHEFSSPPSEFVCEFASGNRFTFGAGQVTVERACATGSPGDSITIEVGGIRSDTVTHE